MLQFFFLADKENMVKIILDSKIQMIHAKNDDKRTPIFYALLGNGKFSPKRINIIQNTVQ